MTAVLLLCLIFNYKFMKKKYLKKQEMLIFENTECLKTMQCTINYDILVRCVAFRRYKIE